MTTNNQYILFQRLEKIIEYISKNPLFSAEVSYGIINYVKSLASVYYIIALKSQKEGVKINISDQNGLYYINEYMDILVDKNNIGDDTLTNYQLQKKKVLDQILKNNTLPTKEQILELQNAAINNTIATKKIYQAKECLIIEQENHCYISWLYVKVSTMKPCIYTLVCEAKSLSQEEKNTIGEFTYRHADVIDPKLILYAFNKEFSFHAQKCTVFSISTFYSSDNINTENDSILQSSNSLLCKYKTFNQDEKEEELLYLFGNQDVLQKYYDKNKESIMKLIKI